VKHVCFADELLDFTRIHARSAGLKIDNDYNALYAEYLFRAQGTAGEWIVYQVPADMEKVIVTAFSAEPVSEMSLLVSADGETFSPIQPERVARAFPSPPGGAAGNQRRTMVESTSAVPTGMRFLKIVWSGPAWLDRVEIHHP
jgi:hypothetical protein